MKYLLTGGCGFLGSNISSALIRRAAEVIVFDNLSRAGSEKNLEWLKTMGECRHVMGDVRNTNDINNLVQAERPDVIFHLAGQVAMTTSIENPRMDFEINALGTLNLLEAVRKYSPGSAILYSSTNKAYGDLEWARYGESDTRYIAVDYPKGFPETISIDFHSPYGCSKGTADQYMLDYCRIYGLNTAVFRHSSMYGGRQFSTFDQGWIGWFVQKALDIKSGLLKEPFTISGNGKQVRDVLYSEDMVALYLKAAQDMKTIRGHAFNVGGGMDNSLSLLELFSMLQEKVGVELKYVKLPARTSDQKVFVADISKIGGMTGWAPRVGKDAGIGKMIDWVKNGR
ncbi:MAG: GDP-mannose 4,6-dehydratase [Elusimicrobia bacterium]|nr:GDP-mannose 4,6-dehydratase [Elusimicrobiota bacterium]